MRLFQLQILQGSYYYNIAESNRTQYFHIPAPRGRIFDRHGTKLTGNQPQYTLFVSIMNITEQEKKEIAQGLGNITDFKPEYITGRFSKGERLPFGNIRLLANLTREEVKIIEENIHNFPRLSVQIEPRREYPYGPNGSHLLGHIGEINKDELTNLRKYGYRMGDKVGKIGLEEKYDRSLRGEAGFQKLEVGVKGEHKEILKNVEPRIGNDIVLSIDWDLQQAAWEAMKDKDGAVVAMDPKTGELLVWISKPGFNPEDFSLPLAADKAREIFMDPTSPLFNRIIQGQYEPGSIFKLVTAIAALDKGKATPETEFTCRGSIEVGYDRRVFRCWQEREHGEIQLAEAIARSCNVYFYQLGLNTGIEDIGQTALQLGFSQPSQNIFTREATGNIPSPRWKQNRFSQSWYPGDTVNTSVGQGYVLVNTMQVLKLTSLIATKGEFTEPHISKMEISPGGKVIRQISPPETGKVDMNPDIFDIVNRAMTEVTEYGTASFLNMPFPVGAKTGTAQNPGGDDHAWFTCFAPAEDPQIAITVFIERGGYGAVGAMPVARQILNEKFLNNGEHSLE